eukprot:scaffold49657_cov65-Phaeocystis_antarctica.AAC.1
MAARGAAIPCTLESHLATAAAFARAPAVTGAVWPSATGGSWSGCSCGPSRDWGRCGGGGSGAGGGSCGDCTQARRCSSRQAAGVKPACWRSMSRRCCSARSTCGFSPSVLTAHSVRPQRVAHPGTHRCSGTATGMPSCAVFHGATSFNQCKCEGLRVQSGGVSPNSLSKVSFSVRQKSQSTPSRGIGQKKNRASPSRS